MSWLMLQEIEKVGVQSELPCVYHLCVGLLHVLDCLLHLFPLVRCDTILNEQSNTRIEISDISLEHEILLALRTDPGFELTQSFLGSCELVLHFDILLRCQRVHCVDRVAIRHAICYSFA